MRGFLFTADLCLLHKNFEIKKSVPVHTNYGYICPTIMQEDIKNG